MSLLAFALYVARNPGYFFENPEQETIPPKEMHTEINTETVTEAPPATEPKDTEAIQIEQIYDALLDLGNGLIISEIGKYSGIYMEDGSDEVVSGLLMIVVANTTDADLQYADIQLKLRDGSASFSLTTLPAGSSAVVLAQNRVEYDADEAYDSALTNHLAWFSAPLDLCQDRVKIQALDGVMNISNISGEDISGDVVIYYKNASADMFYGGITYRVRITGGLAAGEIRQIQADHFSENGSKILFVTCG